MGADPSAERRRALTDLPPGFELDAPVAIPSQPHGLPDGFELDAPAAAPAAPSVPQAKDGYEPHTFTLSNIVKGLYNSAVSGATLPRDVYQGRVDPSSDEAVQRAWDLAGIASPMTPGKLTTQAERSMLFADPRSKTTRAAEEAAANPAAAAANATAAKATPTEIAAAADAVGMPIPRAALLPSFLQKGAAGLSDLPFIGKPLQQSAENSLARAQERVGDIASTIGTPSVETAGTGIQRGIKDYKAVEIPKLDAEHFGPITSQMPTSAQFVPSETALSLAQIGRRLDESGGSLGGEAGNVSDLVGRGRVTFKGLQDARSRLGAQLQDKFNSAGYNDAADRQLYGAMSRDLEGFVGQHGGDELAGQWRNANAAHAAAMEQFNTVKPLANISNENSAFETAYNLAMDQRGSVNKLVQLKKTIPAEDWANVAATSLQRMGGPGDGFSMQKFVTSYDKMSPSARTVLFGENSKAVENLATSFRALQGIERFKSKSQSANPTAMGGLGAALVAHPVPTILGGVTGYILSNQLAKPATLNAVSNIAKTHAILANRVSPGLIRQADEQSKRLGVMLVDGGAPQQAANDIVRSLGEATRSIYPGSARSAAEDDQHRSP